MAKPRPTAAERAREEREALQHKTRLSMRVGGFGVAVLFLCGFGIWWLPEDSLLFLGGMVAGIILLILAMFLVWSSPMRLHLDDETKIY